MIIRDRECRAEGCTVPAAWCEAHTGQTLGRGWPHRHQGRRTALQLASPQGARSPVRSKSDAQRQHPLQPATLGSRGTWQRQGVFDLDRAVVTSAAQSGWSGRARLGRRRVSTAHRVCTCRGRRDVAARHRAVGTCARCRPCRKTRPRPRERSTHHPRPAAWPSWRQPARPSRPDQLTDAVDRSRACLGSRRRAPRERAWSPWWTHSWAPTWRRRRLRCT